MDGRVGVTGVPAKALTWAELVGRREGEGRAAAWSSTTSRRPGSTFPFGAHIAVVEVDTETGRVVPIRHIAVDDCGTILNPLLVDGQVHGGLASGISQALWEEFVYDDDGNPLTSTLADYAIPSAAEFPSFEAAHTETPSPLNPLGAKGIGESATVGSTPAVQNAVVDALSHLGVRHVDMPAHARARVARDRGRQGRHAARPVARASGRVRRPPRATPAPAPDEEINL